MAGINDLGRGNQTADRVFVQLQSMISRASGAATTAVVVIAPWANRFVARSSDNETQRLRLLQMLLQRFEPARVAPGLPKLLLDRVAFDQFRFWEQPQDQRRQYQDDELHLTERGYDTLGGHVFDTLAKGGALAALKCGCVGAFLDWEKCAGWFGCYASVCKGWVWVVPQCDFVPKVCKFHTLTVHMNTCIILVWNASCHFLLRSLPCPPSVFLQVRIGHAARGNSSPCVISQCPNTFTLATHKC